MKLKTIDVNGTTYAVIQDGMPVYTHDDGKDLPFDAPGTAGTIKRLNAEAKGHREEKEAAQATLKAFEGLDAEAARKAIGIVKNLDEKRLVDAGQVETVKAEAIKAVEEKYAPVVKERDKFRDQLISEKVGGSFARSKFIADKVAAPMEMLQATFGTNFKVEDGNVVGYDASGNKMFSRAKPGELAGFDEALEMLIDAAPFRDRVMKGTGANGGGSQGGNSGANKGKTITRAAFDAMPLDQRGPYMKDGGTVTD